jgi:hypothetical protein
MIQDSVGGDPEITTHRVLFLVSRSVSKTKKRNLRVLIASRRLFLGSVDQRRDIRSE